MKSDKRKRAGISSKTRWDVFRRDGFKCIYCGSCEELVIDHVDPFARGGIDSQDNFATACRRCNSGKRDKVLVPPLAVNQEFFDEQRVVSSGVSYRNHLHKDWGQALQHADCFSAVEYIADKKLCQGADFSMCSMLTGQRRYMRVVIASMCDERSPEQQNKIREAVSRALNRDKTILLIGSPFYFYAMVIDLYYPESPCVGQLTDSLTLSDRTIDRSDLEEWLSLTEEDFVEPADAFYLKARSFPWRKRMDEIYEGSCAIRNKSN